MHYVSERRDHRLTAVGCALIALAFVVVLAFAARAQAAETLYWDNYGSDEVAFANVDGTGGGALNLGTASLGEPEGMAYDAVTNRLFVAEGEGTDGQILAVNLDGSGASAFSAPGAAIEEPEGIAIDPASRTLYWVNTAGSGSIGWAKLDGSAGGVLNTQGATVNEPYRGIAVDPASGKVYWSNSGTEPEVISFANADNSGGGGDLNLTGAPAPTEITGLAVDPSSGRIYWLDKGAETIGFASLGGGNGGEVALSSTAAVDQPYGLAFDPSVGRFYWGNYGNTANAEGAFGFQDISGGGGGIDVASAPVDGPQDPVILKSPIGAGAPTVTRSATAAASLSCSQGTWASFPGSFVYAEPRSYGYQWTKDGAAVQGATSATLNATEAGTYACTVTGTNQEGTASQTSAGVPVTGATLTLTRLTKKPHAVAGGTALVKVRVANGGELPSSSLRLCVQVPKKKRKYLKAPKCGSVGQLAAHATAMAKLRVKTSASAGGRYKVSILVKGGSAKPLKASIKVTPKHRRHGSKHNK